MKEVSLQHENKHPIDSCLTGVAAMLRETVKDRNAIYCNSNHSCRQTRGRPHSDWHVGYGEL